MREHSVAVVALVAGLAVVSGAGCNRDQPPALSDEQKHTLEKLRQQVDRENAERDPNSRLAKLATDRPAPTEGDRPLPKGNAPLVTGPLKISLNGVHTAHQVSGGKLSVASEDWFLRVTLHVENTSKASVPVNFSLVRLLSGETELPRARDAQRLAGTRELDRKLPKGFAEPVILYFEVPSEALGVADKPLTLHFPPAVAGGADARLPIE